MPIWSVIGVYILTRFVNQDSALDACSGICWLRVLCCGLHVSPGIRAAKLVEASWMVNQLLGVIVYHREETNRTLPHSISSESVDVASITDTDTPFPPKY